MKGHANWSYPTNVHFGAGRIVELGSACKSLGVVRPLVVTDEGIASSPIGAAIESALSKVGLELRTFSEFRSNPVGSEIELGVDFFRSGQHDGVIALGGGSALDVGKAIAFMSNQQVPIWDFEDLENRKVSANTEGLAPVIAIPTAAGTGSEMGRASIIIDENTHTKNVIFHPRMLPDIVIADPELTCTLPKWLTAATGMDAFSHCLEADCADAFHPLADGIAVEGMRLIKSYLFRAFKDGDDLDARTNMLAAAAMGAAAFQKGLGAMHAMSHSIGALYDTQHGLTNAIVMPYVLEFNRKAIESKVQRLAAWLELTPANFESFFKFIMELRESLEIPANLRALGLRDPDINRLAEMASVDPSAAGNPIKLTMTDLRALLCRAYEGI